MAWHVYHVGYAGFGFEAQTGLVIAIAVYIAVGKVGESQSQSCWQSYSVVDSATQRWVRWT